MAIFLIVAFLLIPVAEIAVFIQVGDLVGLGPTLLGIFLTAILGAALVRRQGFETLRRSRASFDRNELPVAELFDGLCLLAAGALLLTPGFLTDAVGFLLLLPPLRGLLRRLLWAELQRRGATVHVRRSATAPGGPRHPGGWPSGRSDGEVIEGEFVDVSDEEERNRPSGGFLDHDNPWKPRR